MMRTIAVTQPALIDSSLSLLEEGTPDGTFSFRGLLKRSAQLDLGHQRLTFTTLGLLGRSVRAEAVDGSGVGEFRQTGITGRVDAEVNGRRYRLKVIGVLARRYCWIDTDGTAAVCLKLGGLVRTSGTIEITETTGPDDASVLIGLGLMARRALESDSGSGAAGGAG
ncbi:hypothetical protein [Nocardioides sp.]|uniref:hypothetical protein n=1 Tax=Nocardioides sp. TaxID=35761 RepID=UPI002B8AB3E3|nr:hypothetical protein [Nocardioides sp.]HXH81185.1 hypothetical protein [Nocardioides sp.]